MHAVCVFFTTHGSHFASLDQVPQTLLMQLGHGGVHGIHAQQLMMRAGMPSVSLRAVQMGIDKEKGLSHLYKGHRPVLVTNPIPRAESRVAKRKLAATLELSGHYTHTHFPYRRDICPAFMVLVLRAVRTHTLLRVGQFAVVDWDESDAYLRPERHEETQLNALLRPM